MAEDEQIPKKEPRPSSAKRGYDYQWRKFRTAYLKKNPMCCRQGCRELATEIDHEPELTGPDDPGRLDEARCAPLCKSHHSQKTAKQTHAKNASRPAPPLDDNYERYREEQADRSRKRSESGRDIGTIPPVANSPRRKACEHNFRLFCESYFPARFDKPWGTDHIEVLEIIQRVVLEGGKFPLAMPRGSGKTTLATCAVIFAVLYGHRKFVVFIGSTAKVAEGRLDEMIRQELEQNDLLLEDFPEVCYPIIKLERNTTRARMQTQDGEFTLMEWGQSELRLPTVEGSSASGVRIACAGLATGDIRGLLVRGPDGKLERPDLVICDDPQTDESARMPGQCDTRENLLTGAVAGLAGPGKKIAIIVPCTVIRPRDLSDRLLDRSRHPEWQGRKFKLIDKLPDRIDLWQEYGELLRDGIQETPPTREKATRFYEGHRDEMDAGADLSWPARFEPDQISAIQFAMDLYLLKPAVFAAEYQNEPLSMLETGGAEPIDPSATAEKVNTIARGTVPVECSRLTAFFDPKQEIIFWTVVAWDEKFGGSVIDYGTFPRQHSSDFSGTDPSPSLSDVFRDKKLSLEARLFAGMTQVANEILPKAYARADNGPTMNVDQCLVDVGWGPYAELLHKWCRETQFKAIVKASKGAYIGAARSPFSDWQKKPGDRMGPGWRIRTAGTALGRLVTFDANMWKTFIAERFRSAPGSHGSLSLFGSSQAAHKKFCDHLAAETPIRVSAGGRTVDEWTINAGRPDNDFLDCMVGCAVAASTLGLRLTSREDGSPDVIVEPKPLKYSDTRTPSGQPVTIPTPAAGPVPLRYADQRRKLGR